MNTFLLQRMEEAAARDRKKYGRESKNIQERQPNQDNAHQNEVQADKLGKQDLSAEKQPKLVTGGRMRGYQLEGLSWLRRLWLSGLNGILADEMGLGKTIQIISLIAFLREVKTYGPFLVVAPLSTLQNWIDEFARFTPTIPTVLYHGTPSSRQDIRRNRLKKPKTPTFPVVCTSYEICMNDRKFLSKFEWSFIIIDEGHRLKNMNCRLLRELKSYTSANRLLITGTPLQNNLSELWSLLNFLMPELFDTYERFESLFDFSDVLSKRGHREIIKKEEQNNLISAIHSILKPFLLRRVKTDVATDLPPKREYVLYAPLTKTQKELYRQIRAGNSRAYLENQATEQRLEQNLSLRLKGSVASLKRKLGASDADTPNKSGKTSRASTPASARARKTKSRLSYAEKTDDEFFGELEQATADDPADTPSDESLEDDEDARVLQETKRQAKREISAKKLQNPIMQLRLACNSPHNFYWPWEDANADRSLVTESGKMMLLERLVPHLLDTGHKILIFSQFKTQLDILEEWALVLHNWTVCRIDGGVPHDERAGQINAFNTDPSTNLFLLSTRAGGQGINLAAADTVILFDSDWNPQQDLQAQDRAHRIGQTRPVIVYRLATRGTVETTLLEKADGKRRLEKLVIRKGKFRSLTDVGSDDLAELEKLLEQDDGEMMDLEEGEGLLSDKDLAVITDRSEEAFKRAEKGESAGGDLFKVVQTLEDKGILG